MRLLKLAATVTVLSVIVGAPLYAAGLWFGLPVVGGASYCAGATATGVAIPGGGTTSCNVTAPAGPADLTGSELVPADLNLQGTEAVPGTNTSAAAQTGYIPVPSVASGAWLLTNANGLSTVSTSTPQGITNLVLNATGTLTTWNVAPPPGAVDGQLWNFGVNNLVTTITLQTPSNAATFDTQGKVTGTVSNTGTTAATSTVGFSYIYQASANKWWRLK